MTCLYYQLSFNESFKSMSYMSNFWILLKSYNPMLYVGPLIGMEVANLSLIGYFKRLTWLFGSRCVTTPKTSNHQTLTPSIQVHRASKELHHNLCAWKLDGGY